MLDSEPEVIRCLVTYTDWWQPRTTSILEIPPTGQFRHRPNTFRQGFVEHLDERNELVWRMSWLEEVERKLLFLFYVTHLPAAEIASAVGLSTRQCFRRRRHALETLVALGESDEAEPAASR